MTKRSSKLKALGIVKVTFDPPESSEEKAARLTQEKIEQQKIIQEQLIARWEEESSSDEQAIIKYYLENNRSARFVAESQISAVLNLGKNKLKKVVAIIKRYEQVEAAMKKRKGRR